MNENQQNFSFEDLQILNRKLDHQLKELQSGDRTSSYSSSFSFRRLALKALLLIVILVAPFIVLLRVSVEMYLGYQLNG